MKISIFITTILTVFLGLQTSNAMDGITKKECFMSQNERPKYKITVTQGKKELGVMEIELFPDIAPKHCENFDSLVTSGFYDGTAFHRVIPGFMIQGGDPNSKDKDPYNDGNGGPSYTIPAEINAKFSHNQGAVAAARMGDNVNPKKESSGSQFYIVENSAGAHFLDNNYTVFGQVIKGIEVVEQIAIQSKDERDRPKEAIVMKVTFKKLKRKKIEQKFNYVYPAL